MGIRIKHSTVDTLDFVDNCSRIKLIEYVVAAIGPTMTSIILRQKHMEAMQYWAKLSDYNDFHTMRLRTALKCIKILEKDYLNSNIATWFFMSNDKLGYKPPYIFIKESMSNIVNVKVVKVAIEHTY